MQLTLQIEHQPPPPTLPGDGAALVAFMSFAVSRGFGATHPLIALADRLHDAHHVRMGPLTTFYDATIEDDEDAAKIELAWQSPRELRDALSATLAAIATDETCRTLLRRANAEALPEQAAALLAPLSAAEAMNERVRLVYAL